MGLSYASYGAPPTMYSSAYSGTGGTGYSKEPSDKDGGLLALGLLAAVAIGVAATRWDKDNLESRML